MRSGVAINALGVARATPCGRRGITQFRIISSQTWLTHRIALERQKTSSVCLLVANDASARQIGLASSTAHVPPVGLVVLHSRTQFRVTHLDYKENFDRKTRLDSVIGGAGLVLVVGRMPVSRPRLVFMRRRLAAE